MSGARRDVAELEQVALVDIGIELGLALHVVDPLRPAHEMGDRAHRPVAVEHLEPHAVRREAALDRGERIGGLRGQQATRPLVAVDALADEIVVAEIAHLDDETLDHGGGIDEARGQQPLRAHATAAAGTPGARMHSVTTARMLIGVDLAPIPARI